MLIYEIKKGLPYVTQVIQGFNESEIQTFKTSFQKIHEKHRFKIRLLSEGFVFVTGDTSLSGNGIKIRSDYKHYLGGTSGD